MAVEQGDNPEIPRESHPTGTRVNVNIIDKLLMGTIRLYQISLSRQLPPSCRFYPSCSEYTLQAIGKYGAVKGVWLGIKRISRCHPFHPGGYDPVP